MKTMKYPLLLTVLAVGLCSNLLAQDQPVYARVALCLPGVSREPVNKDDYIILVVEGDSLSYDKNPIPNTGVIDYVNQLLRDKRVSYVGLCVREGTRFKGLMHAVDLLRETKATNIGISEKELPLGREP